jgi:hypothetical protein
MQDSAIAGSEGIATNEYMAFHLTRSYSLFGQIVVETTGIHLERLAD